MNAPTNELPDWLAPPQVNHTLEANHGLIASYLAHNWKLCRVPAGTKGPQTKGWNKLENALTEPPTNGDGVGLLHAYSSTCAIDVDQLDAATALFAERGIDLAKLMAAPDAVMVHSGNPDHAKMLYRLEQPLPSKRISANGRVALEFRCATADGASVQDVLAGATHPSGTTYTWAGSGHWQNLPALPEALHAWWLEIVAKDAERTIPVHGGASANWNEVRSAVYAIDPSCPHDDWLTVGMALHSIATNAGEPDSGLQLWNEWSRNSEDKYPGPDVILTRWNSFDADRPVGIKAGSLFKLAKDSGWVRPIPDVSGLFANVTKDIKLHPLLSYQTGYSNEGTEFVIDGVIVEGPVILPADRGLGKTTAIVSLACKVAHLCPENDPLRPTIRRNVVYLTEDPKQVQRILYAMGRENQFGLDGDTFECRLAEAFERIKVVPTVRLSPEVIVQVAEEYNKTLTVPNERNGVRYDAPPWVIFDTTSASIDLEEENSNSEIGKAVSLLKTEFYTNREIPFLLVAHTAKAMKHADVSKLSARGGGAWEADVHQVVYMSTDDKGGRFLEVGTPNAKKRFSPKFYSIAIGGHIKECVVTNRFKEITTEWITWASLTPMTKEEVTGIKEKAEVEAEYTTEEKGIAKMIEKFVRFFEENPEFVGSKNKICQRITGKREYKITALDRMIADNVLEFAEADGDSDEKTVIGLKQKSWRDGA